MCPRCRLLLLPMTAEECFEGHARPENAALWTVWVCPRDHQLVVPEDINVLDVLEANKNHQLLEHLVRDVPGGEPGSTGIDWDRLVNHYVAIPPPDHRVVPSVQVQGPADLPEQPQGPADPNDALVTIVAPILAGFSLAAIVTIGTAATVGPGALPAMACFAGSAVLLLFSLQMLAIGRLPGLRAALWPRWVKAILYELGLLVFLVGLGLILWLRAWPAAAIAGVVVVGAAVICDLVLQAMVWCRRDQWGRRRLSLGTRSAALDCSGPWQMSHFTWRRPVAHQPTDHIPGPPIRGQ
jgi:hypothetical protein